MSMNKTLQWATIRGLKNKNYMGLLLNIFCTFVSIQILRHVPGSTIEPCIA